MSDEKLTAVMNLVIKTWDGGITVEINTQAGSEMRLPSYSNLDMTRAFLLGTIIKAVENHINKTMIINDIGGMN